MRAVFVLAISVFYLGMAAQVRIPEVMAIVYPNNVESVVRTEYSAKVSTTNNSSDTVWKPVLIITKKFSTNHGCIYAEYDHVDENYKATNKWEYNADSSKYTNTKVDRGDTTFTVITFGNKRKTQMWSVRTKFPTDTTAWYYEYDSLGRRSVEYKTTEKEILASKYNYGKSGEILIKEEREYDTIKRIWTLSNDSCFYYDSGLRLRAICVHAYIFNGKLLFADSMNVYYNEKGQIVSSAWSIVGGSNFRGYTYDKQGVISTEMMKSGRGIVLISWKTTYNKQGLPVECIYSYQGRITRCTWSYTYRK